MLNTTIKDVVLAWQTSHGRTATAAGKTEEMIVKSLTYDNATSAVTVITNSGAGGSAYLNAIDAEGQIVWSWHIWVTKDDATNTNTHITTALSDKMMDRALGAISKTAGINSFGMFYQWGRKDPFTPNRVADNSKLSLLVYDINAKMLNPSSSEDVIDDPFNPTVPACGIDEVFKYNNISLTQNDISTLIQNPTTFYKSPLGNTEVDWWHPTTKTIYDPCPDGYMVAPNVYDGNGWGGNVNHSRKWKGSDFALNGHRLSNSGIFAKTDHGYYWSSPKATTSSARSLQFIHDGEINAAQSADKSCGFAVRCVMQ